MPTTALYIAACVKANQRYITGGVIAASVLMTATAVSFQSVMTAGSRAGRPDGLAALADVELTMAMSRAVTIARDGRRMS
jgi:hypothetical protein